MEEFDKIEVYVAIADYTPDEDNNIPLHVGQHLQVRMWITLLAHTACNAMTHTHRCWICPEKTGGLCCHWQLVKKRVQMSH